MNREHFMLCVRTYYPFAHFFEFEPDELDVAQDLPEDYWAEPEKQWLPYFHFINGLTWDHGKVYVEWNLVKGTPANQERKLLSFLKQLCTTGIPGRRSLLHNVPPLSAIYPPKKKDSLVKRLAGWIRQ